MCIRDRFPALNTGVPFCLAPWMSSDLTSSPVGLTGVTVSVYLALAGEMCIRDRASTIPIFSSKVSLLYTGFHTWFFNHWR